MNLRFSQLTVVKLLSLILLASTMQAPAAFATVVRFETSLGNFDIRLFDKATPLTAQNLLAYINANLYDGTFIHRSVPEFIIQGGGFFYNSANNTAPPISTFDPVPNEPGISNIRGTLAMAKLGGDPDSATSQWFPNLAHNTANLDNQNGGFTVFAAMLGNGMSIADDIADLPIYDVDGSGNTFNAVPLRTGTSLADRLVFINDVYVLQNPAGDFNLDGTVDQYDLQIWQADYGRLVFAGGDFNDDKEIDGGDLAIWQTGYGQFNPMLGTWANYTDGDADGDKDVDGRDFLAWQRGAGGTTDVAADGNGDARINGRDFLLWQRTFGQSLPTQSLLVIPEPSSVAIVGIALLGFATRRSR